MNLFWFHSALRLWTPKKGPSKRKYSPYKHLSKDMCCYFPLPSPSANLFSAFLFCGSATGLPCQWLSHPQLGRLLPGFSQLRAVRRMEGERRRGQSISPPSPLCVLPHLGHRLSLHDCIPGEELCVSSSSQRLPCSNSVAVSSQNRPVLREVVTASCCNGSLSFSASLVGALHLPSLQVEPRLSLFTWLIRVNFSFLMGPWQIGSSSCHTCCCAISRRDSGYRNVPSMSSHIAAPLGEGVLLPLFNVLSYLGKKGLLEAF